MKNRLPLYVLSACLLLITALTASAEEQWPVKITEQTAFVEVDHMGTPVYIQRVQDTNNRLIDSFSKTSRQCPPFCITRMQQHEKVETVGELEVIDFIKTDVLTSLGLLIDTRLPESFDAETIPRAVNIPFVLLAERPESVLPLLGVTTNANGEQNFNEAKELIIFCNGPWSDQTPRAIKSLLAANYPPEKIHYYRGGLQMWKLFSLTTITPVVNKVG